MSDVMLGTHADVAPVSINLAEMFAIHRATLFAGLEDLDCKISLSSFL
jgi:hypothetical protein